MDNQQSVSEVQSSVRQPRSSGLLKVKRLDPLTMPGDEMNALWEKIKTQEFVFSDESKDDPNAFVLGLVTPSSYHFIANDSLYVICRNVWKGSNVDWHYIPYNKDFHARDIVETGRQVLEWLFKEKQVARVSSYIPKFNPNAVRLVSILGFKYEGTMRQAVKWQNEMHDVDLYGLLPKEFERRFKQ